jgi:hypothetical protein
MNKVAIEDIDMLIKVNLDLRKGLKERSLIESNKKSVDALLDQRLVLMKERDTLLIK